jgi:hypothetical protein
MHMQNFINTNLEVRHFLSGFIPLHIMVKKYITLQNSEHILWTSCTGLFLNSTNVLLEKVAESQRVEPWGITFS